MIEELDEKSLCAVCIETMGRAILIGLIIFSSMVLTSVAHAQSFRDCATCPEMVAIPADAFTMGPVAGEEEREGGPEGNRPGSTRRVTIESSFAIGKYEITRGEFSTFVAATHRQAGKSCWVYNAGKPAEIPGLSWRDPGFAQTDRDPAVCVSWNDAVAYAAWLQQLTGKAYRLPSEAEWEYAARAGLQAARHWGDTRDDACLYGNFADQTAASKLNLDNKPEIVLLNGMV